MAKFPPAVYFFCFSSLKKPLLLFLGTQKEKDTKGGNAWPEPLTDDLTGRCPLECKMLFYGFLESPQHGIQSG